MTHSIPAWVSSVVRIQFRYAFLSACARGDQTAGPRLRLSTLNWIPVASIAWPHQAAQCVYLAHQVALRRSADGGVARHVGHRLSRERAQSDTQPQTRYRPRGLATGMSSANDDDIKERLQAQSLVIRGTSPMAEIVGVESWAQSQTPHRPAFVAPRPSTLLRAW